ncbi:unnamed protein product [Brassica napus]|uniref:(rape) hypothetical protein n=1 Tax=Brassica napus TaxID=3708 RepID=A0A816X324_BRANA|nr:unnamed protein product [Brassica napus]
MRKNVTPSSAIYDPLAPDYPALLEKLMQHIKAIPPKPPAPPAGRSSHSEGGAKNTLHKTPRLAIVGCIQ